ncbi:MarR family winged helix-turn-helix transcriptional regulator [Taklimakanibacter deserti]|uniref:MarR family winged helix-turn-helix transcriptional regulator n=1 Tax=Taklimakanibacter deserti TaxID=2267839 RepID=UPI000E64BA43
MNEPQKTEAAKLLTEIVLLTFRLEGGFLAAADRISAPAGLTAARWKVLGAVLYEKRSVAEIGRVMGLTRQSVQRLADILVAEGIAAYEDNPAHRSAKLLVPTAEGRARIAKLSGRQTDWANRVSDGLDPTSLAAARDMLKTLIDRVEATEVPA